MTARLDVATAQIDQAMQHAQDGRPTAVRGSSFVHAFQPQESLIDGLPASQGRVIAITGPTGHGKTAIATAMQLHILTGTRFGGREVMRGRVMALCGENPDDYSMRLIATMQEARLEPVDLDDLIVVPSTFSLGGEFGWLESVAREAGGVCAVFVDTSAAFFTGENENDNVSMRLHASALRALADLPGKPAVFVLCHPTKNATKDSLLPRGGGAFLAEVDANLTVWKDEAGIATLHWSGKMRGPNFDPIKFELKPRPLDGYADAKGRSVNSVVAVYVADDAAEQIEQRELDDENRLLLAMFRKPGSSISALALACGWTSGTGVPSKSRVARALDKLRRQELAEKSRLGAWQLTSKGKREVEQLR